MERKPLRKVSAKRAAANREYLKVREIYLRENPKCARCRGVANQIHHLCSGGNRAASLVNTETWLGLCDFCHGFLQDAPTILQVMVKVEHTIETINRLRGRAESAITLEELQ